MPPNKPPVARVSIIGNRYVGQTIKIDATSSTDPDGLIRRTIYQLGDGEQVVSKKPLAIDYIYKLPGFYDVVVIVEDNKGAVSSVKMQIGILRIGPNLIVPNQSVSANSPFGAPVIVILPDPPIPAGGVPPYTTTYVPPPDNLFPVGETSVVTTVVDSIGNSGTGTLIVTVIDTSVPPNPPIVITPPANQNVSSSDGNPVSCSWTNAGVTGGVPPYTVIYKLEGTTIITSPHDFAVGLNTIVIEVTDSVLATTSSSFTITVTSSEPLPNNSHPRLLLVADGFTHARTLTQCKNLCATGGAFASDFATWLTALNRDLTSEHLWREYQLALGCSFAFLMHGISTTATFAYNKAQYGALARSNMLASMVAGFQNDAKPHIMMLALDWLQADGDIILSASDKTTAMNWVKSWFTNGDTGPYLNVDNSPGPAYYNSYCAISRSITTLGALALSGSGADDTRCESIIAAQTQLYRNDTDQRGVTYAWSQYCGVDGGFAQGEDYGWEYVTPYIFLAEEGYRTAKAITKATHYGTSDTDVLTSLAKYVARWYCNDAFPRTSNPAMPDSYAWLFSKRNGQYYPHIPDGQNVQTASMLSALTGFSPDANQKALAKWLITHRTGPVASKSGADRSWTVPFQFCMADPTVVAQSPDDLGMSTSKLHSNGPVTMRTDWDTDVNSPWVAVDMTTFCTSIYASGRGGGELIIYRKGPVVLQQGIGVHDVGASVHIYSSIMNFPNRAQTWQQVTPYSPTYPTFPASNPSGTGNVANNQGGTRSNFDSNNNVTTDFTVGSVLDFTGETRSVLTGACQYIFRNLTKQYDNASHNDTGEVRISNYVRQVVYFLPPDPDTDSVRVVVFDRSTVTDVKYEHNWALTLAGQPIISNGSPVAGPSRGPEGTTGKTHSTTTTEVTCTITANGCDSKLWFTPVLPASRDVIALYRAWSVGSAVTYENRYGVLAAEQPLINEQQLGAPGRIEVVPSTPSLTENHLHVIEVTNSNGSKSIVTAISGSGFTGVKVGSGVAVFGSDGFTKTSGTFTIPANSTVDMRVSDLDPSTSRTLTPDSHGNINGLGAGVAYTANCGTEGSLYVTLVTDTTSCLLTIS